MSKSVATSSKDLVNASLLEGFSSVVEGGLETELYFFNEMISLMPDSLSVNGAKATIAQVEADKGKLPSLVSSASQDFVLCGVVRALIGGKDSTLTDSLNVAIQGRKRIGAKAFATLLSAETATFANIKKAVYNTPVKVKAKSEKVSIEGVEALVKALLEAFDSEDFDGLIPNIEEGELLIKRMNALVKHSKQVNHPSAKSA